MSDLLDSVVEVQPYALDDATLAALAKHWSKLPRLWALLKARSWPDEIPGREPLDQRSPRVRRIMQLIHANVGLGACQVAWDSLPPLTVAMGKTA